MTDPVIVQKGDGPVILGQPHCGTFVADAIADRLNDNGRLLADTDWHIDRLYDGLLPGVTVVRATFHRYVIDANRDPSGKSLYPGQNTTQLVPLTDFNGKAIWHDGEEPNGKDIANRLETYHRPYHRALAAEVERVRRRHGIAILYDCHSIRSVIPYLFDGVLPALNIGTNDGKSCSPEIEAAVRDICKNAEGYTSILNGRFKGGWTTRQYGRPDDDIHAVQMEIAQSAYLATEAVPFSYDRDKAERLRAHLGAIVNKLENIAASIGGDK